MYWYIYKLTALCVRTRNVRANVSRTIYTYKHRPICVCVGGGGGGGGGAGRWKIGAHLCIPGPCDMSCYQSHIDHNVHMSVHHGKYFAHVQTCDT